MFDLTLSEGDDPVLDQMAFGGIIQIEVTSSTLSNVVSLRSSLQGMHRQQETAEDNKTGLQSKYQG